MPLLPRLMLLLAALSAAAAAAATPCAGPFALQVLGSGGPEANAERASSGYLVWMDGRARILIDAGGGTFARFGASGARFADLDLIVLTHLHADHASELPALLKSGYFSPRSRSLSIAGPTGGGEYPDLEGYLLGLIGPQQGAFRYLAGYLDGSDGLVRLARLVLDARRREVMPVYSAGGVSVTAMGVTHGPVPALAYRVEYEGRGIVLSGDQNGDDPEFVDFTRGADLLIMDHAVPENAGRVAANLHALPSEIGDISQAAEVKQLLLSHIMNRSERALDQSLELIGERYRGRVRVAHDLMCVTP